MSISGKAAQEREERALRALKLRQRGATYREIAKRLSIRPQTAQKIIHDYVQFEIQDSAQEILWLEIQRLDAMVDAVWDRVLEGDVTAGKLILSIMDRRAKYLGLDSPVRAELSGPDGGPIRLGPAVDLKKFSDDELKSYMALLKKARFDNPQPQTVIASGVNVVEQQRQTAAARTSCDDDDDAARGYEDTGGIPISPVFVDPLLRK